MSRPTFPPHIHKSKILGDKYMIGDEIGRGASGRVYKGLDLENGDFVAIKQISLENICEEDLNVIMQEIDLLKILNHKNIVKYLGSLNTKTDLNIILEYVENGSLDNIIKPSKFGPFPETLAAVYIAQVLEGLVYLHEQGVIHRDIKGANILTTKEGLVKLTDFGVATKLNGSGVNTTFVAGTPYWMAPEVIDLSGSCAASDIWSVGCTVIELLTCFPPYHDLPHYAALYRIVKDEVPPIPANLSPDVRDFLHQCFKKDAKQRPDASTLLLHPWMQNLSRSFQSSVRQTGGTMRSTQPEVSVDSEISIGDDQSNGENPTRERTNRDASNTEPEQEAFGMRSDKDVLSDKNPTSAFDEKSYIRSSSHRLSSTRVDAPSNLTSPHKNSNMVGLDERTLNGEVCALDLRKEGIIGGECEGEGSSALQSKIRRYGTQKDAEFNKLVGSLKPDEPEDVIVSACQKLITFFEEFPDEKIAFVTQHGLLPLMELLEVPKNHVISSVLLIINQIVKENANFQEYACFLGLIPVMMNFAAPKCPQEVRMQAAYFLQQLCESSSSTLQMFIACRGIPVLVGFLEADYIKYREMIHLAIDCMWQVFKLPHSTQRKDFCRIAAMNGILPRLVNTLYSLNEATRLASSSDDGSLPAFGLSPRPQSVPQDPSQPLSKQGETPLSCSRKLGPHEVMPGISDHPLPAGNLERSASHVQLEAAVTSLPELASEGEAGNSITKDSVKSTSQDWKRLGSYKHNSYLAEADLHRQQGVTGRGSSDKPLKQVLNGTPRISNSLASEQDQVGPFLRLLEKEPPSRHGSGKLEYVRQHSGLMRRESRLPLLQTSVERKSAGELDFLMAEFADVSRQGRENKNLYSNTSFSHKTGDKSFKTARMGSRTSDEGSASRYEVASWTTSGVLSGSVILREKAGSMASSGVLSHTAAMLDADVAREYLEKVADLLQEFARADTTVKYRMCSPSLLSRLFRMFNRIEHPILLKILKCINHLSTDANCLESLQRANAIKHLILYLELHDGPLISQIHNEVLNALFNLCKINKKRMEQAAENGIVPHLMHFINSDSPLKQCALPLLCDMAYASSNSREQLRACGGLDVYLSLLDDDLWSVTALDSLSVCLALDNDQRRVEQELLKKEAVQKLVKFFKCCPDQYFMNILEPFLKIITKSSRINTTLAVNGLTPLLIARLDHQNAIARINLLKMIKAVYEHHPRPKQLIVENDLPQKLQCLIEERRDGQPSGGQVLVKQLATALLKALHINTVL